MHPFLNLKGLSDNQLYDKIHELMNYSMMARGNGNQQVINQIESSLVSVYIELEDRNTQKQVQGELTDPVAWDMDSSLTLKRSRITDAESEDKKNQKRRWRPSERQHRSRGA